MPPVPYQSLCPSPLGPLILTSDGQHLTRLQRAPLTGSAGVLLQAHLPVFALARDWLDRYFAGEQPGIHQLPLAPQGTVFQQAVWQLICQIPYGQTPTYGAIARQIAGQLGVPAMSAQAVGGAVGRNPLLIMLPCHRVVGAKGQLTGYAGGLEMKQWLLRHEGSL